MPKVDTGQVRIHFKDIGRGDPVLLHGGMATSKYWRRAWYADALAGNYRLLIPDFRVIGASSRPHDEAIYSLSTTSPTFSR